MVGVRAKNLSIITLAFLGVMSVVLLVGGLKVLDENDPFSLGQLAQFLAFMSIMQNPVRQLGMVVAGWAQGATSGKRLFEVLDQVPEIDDKPGAKDLVLTDGALRFESVDFAYMDEYGDEQVLTNVSFEARPGHTIGIVGPPGSGNPPSHTSSHASTTPSQAESSSTNKTSLKSHSLPSAAPSE